MQTSVTGCKTGLHLRRPGYGLRLVARAAQHPANSRIHLHTPAGQALRRVRIGAQQKQDAGRARGVGNDGSMKRPERRQHITRLQKMGADLQNVRVAERQR